MADMQRRNKKSDNISGAVRHWDCNQHMCTYEQDQCACTSRTTPALLTARPVQALVRLIFPKKIHHLPSDGDVGGILAQHKSCQ
jgi:hypothetical protein